MAEVEPTDIELAEMINQTSLDDQDPSLSTVATNKCDGPPLKTFDLFPCLPFELRDAVWRSSIEPHDVRIGRNLHYDIPGDTKAYDAQRAWMRHTQKPPLILWACRESRSVALEYGDFRAMSHGNFVSPEYKLDEPVPLPDATMVPGQGRRRIIPTRQPRDPRGAKLSVVWVTEKLIDTIYVPEMWEHRSHLQYLQGRASARVKCIATDAFLYSTDVVLNAAGFPGIFKVAEGKKLAMVMTTIMVPADQQPPHPFNGSKTSVVCLNDPDLPRLLDPLIRAAKADPSRRVWHRSPMAFIFHLLGVYLKMIRPIVAQDFLLQRKSTSPSFEWHREDEDLYTLDFYAAGLSYLFNLSNSWCKSELKKMPAVRPAICFEAVRYPGDDPLPDGDTAMAGSGAGDPPARQIAWVRNHMFDNRLTISEKHLDPTIDSRKKRERPIHVVASIGGIDWVIQ